MTQAQAFRNAARWAAMVVALAGTLALAACSGSSAAAAKTGTTGEPRAATGSGAGGAGSAFRPAASGEIADVSGTTMQVQDTTEQTAVTWSAKTTFTELKAATLAAVRVGSCIVATAAATSGSTPTAAPTTAARDITATTVRVQPAPPGSCTGGGRNGPGGRVPSGARRSGFSSGARPSGFPTGARPSGAARIGAIVAGKVTAVSGFMIKVGTGTVRVTAATRYTAAGAVTSAAVKVGLCAVVQGSTGGNGTVAARQVALSPKSGTSCSAGFGARFPGGGQGNG